MPRIYPTDWKTQRKIFELHGCTYKRKEGSHHILIYPGARRAVVIPEYDEIDVEIIRNNMKTVDMSRDQYFNYLSSL
jgi:hypothetical protein